MKRECKIFPCYSVPLVKFLKEKYGIEYEIIGLHPESKLKFWAFIKTEELDTALKMWKATAPK